MSLLDDINTAFRDYVTDGNPGSGAHEPVKAQIRAVLSSINTRINNLATGEALGGVVYSTRAGLYADLAHDANTLGLVLLDSTDAYNGIYSKSGASGAGSWALVFEIGDFLQAAIDAEAAKDAAEAAQTAAEAAQTAAVAAKAAAETAETNAETAETNAETAEANAETAEANAETAQSLAEAAQAAAESAKTDAEQAVADATLLGGGVIEVADGVIDDLYDHRLIGTNGAHVVGELKNTVVPDIGNTRTAVFAEGHEYGTAVILESRVDGASTLTAYDGPIVDCALWISDPEVVSSGVYSAKISWDRKRAPQLTGETVGLSNTDKVAIAAGVASAKQFVANFYGQSFATSIGLDAETVSTSAVDSGNALMPGLSVQSSPYVASRTFNNTIVNLMEDEGETVMSGFAKKFLALMDARGDKVKTLCATSGFGGTEFNKLLSSNPVGNPSAATDRLSYWAEHVRVWRWLKHLTDKVSELSPVVLPPVMVSEGYTESGTPVTTAEDFKYWAERWRDQINAFLAREFGWSPAAPKMPCIMTAPGRTGTNMYSGTTKIFGFGKDSATLAHYLIHKYSRGIFLAGPDYHLPPYSDNTHPSPTGMYYLGEMIARCMFEIMFGSGWTPVVPFRFTRVTQTSFKMELSLMSGNAAIDTTNVTDFANSQKGLVVWDEDTLTELAVSSITAPGDNSITFSVASATANQKLVLDYALWRDLSTGVNFGNVGGARGCIRSTTAHATTLSGGSDQYDWLLPFRERLPISNGTSWGVR